MEAANHAVAVDVAAVRPYIDLLGSDRRDLLLQGCGPCFTFIQADGRHVII